MPPDESDQYEGHVLLESIRMGNAKSKMLVCIKTMYYISVQNETNHRKTCGSFPEKYEYFTDEDVKKAFQYICIERILSPSQIPEYEKITKVLENAMADVSKKNRPKEFRVVRGIIT